MRFSSFGALASRSQIATEESAPPERRLPRTRQIARDVDRRYDS